MTLADFLAAALLFFVPLLWGALGALLSARSGVLPLGLEGMMIAGALGGCLFLSAVETAPEQPQRWMLAAMAIAGLCGLAAAALLGLACLFGKGDQALVGTGLNLLAPALAALLTKSLPDGALGIPYWARIAGETDTFWGRVAFSSLYLTAPAALISLLLTAFLLYKTRLGLRLRFCGEDPQAAESAGVNVRGTRFAAVLIGGFLAGVGGLSLTAAMGGAFRPTAAGCGFVALAAVAAGRWKIIGALLASLLLALLQALPAWPGLAGFPGYEYLLRLAPYFAALLLLSLTGKRARPPRALGVPGDQTMR